MDKKNVGKQFLNNYCIYMYDSTNILKPVSVPVSELCEIKP